MLAVTHQRAAAQPPAAQRITCSRGEAQVHVEAWRGEDAELATQTDTQVMKVGAV